MNPPVFLCIALLLSVPARHPIHVSSAVITFREPARSVGVVLKAFEDDFPPGTDSAAAARYLTERFHLLDGGGRRLPLLLLSSRREGPALILTLESTIPIEPRGARVWHGVLLERFGDQVNVVHARYGRRSATLVFTARDGPRALP